ncbi:bifunctional 4-hydroxy-2-oxoglutarate aldolase/2-dehydro-3-deoxy-phosphogluconate aldolase [Subtercola lobariae]|uniref:2-dehydro-3-deoxy-phosphogluconate aldolase n=1 Tax=Subtercola lobariae TaxID=1588641 RepID=A0A917BFT3_9MICO|nr:bifunctional 4-hydroxy-2-oxoglutarate aldolase/2-dehydro-3-deoxy-phosphogluconate aldolase [Subtercola lobariae]GGF41916.1 2-dehydro-3-deoxy-phosphogluconate aldolase [Subtercola lobariae]
MRQTVSSEAATRLDGALERVPIIGIVRLNSAVAASKALNAILEGGVLAAEVTLTTPGALDIISNHRRKAKSGVLIGAGSVRTVSDAYAALGSGSDFLVTPTFNPEVVALSVAAEIPVMCGACTPTELDAANRAGANYLKLFPAGRLGPDYLRDVRAPMPELRVVPTGGISLENLDEWFDAGAAALAIGNALVAQALADRDNWKEMAEVAAQFVEAARRAAQQRATQSGT